MASNLLAMASNLVGMASNLRAGREPAAKSEGLWNTSEAQVGHPGTFINQWVFRSEAAQNFAPFREVGSSDATEQPLCLEVLLLTLVSYSNPSRNHLKHKLKATR